MFFSRPMTAAAQTSGLTDPSTDKVRLLAIARWLLALLIIHWLITCGRKLAAALHRGANAPDDNFLARHFGTTNRDDILARVTHAVRRATALEADVLARRPTEQGLPIEARRAIAAEIIDICRDLGIFRRARTSVTASRAASRVRRAKRTPSFARPLVGSDSPTPARLATGPPPSSTKTAEVNPAARVYPWSFSRRAPAFAS